MHRKHENTLVPDRRWNRLAAVKSAAGGLLRGMVFLTLATFAFLPAQAPAVKSVAPQTGKVAAVQCSSQLGNVQANTGKLAKLVRQAAGNGAKIVVLPELSITGYLSQDGRTNWHVKGRPMEKEYTGKDAEC